MFIESITFIDEYVYEYNNNPVETTIGYPIELIGLEDFMEHLHADECVMDALNYAQDEYTVHLNASESEGIWDATMDSSSQVCYLNVRDGGIEHLVVLFGYPYDYAKCWDTKDASQQGAIFDLRYLETDQYNYHDLLTELEKRINRYKQENIERINKP